MTYGSLFSGIGGIDLGLDRAGMQCKWQVEVDDYARKVLEKHWPNVPRYRDVRYFLGSKRWRHARDAWSVDLIAGGFPCQDISNAGRREGIDGKRSGLWSEFARIIRLLRPRYVLVENVDAIAVRGLGRVLGDLFACQARQKLLRHGIVIEAIIGVGLKRLNDEQIAREVPAHQRRRIMRLAKKGTKKLHAANLNQLERDDQARVTASLAQHQTILHLTDFRFCEEQRTQILKNDPPPMPEGIDGGSLADREASSMSKLPIPVNPALLERFNRLSIIVRGMAHKMRPADEDMLQTGLAELWELLTKYSDKPDCYMIASVRYAMIDHVRYTLRRQRWDKLEEALCIEPKARLVELSSDQLGDDLDDLLSILDRRMRAAFILHVLLEHTTAETAERLATSCRTVERLVHKAKAILRKELSEEGNRG